jgi:sulfate transport system ATP-binding protein
MTIEVRNLTKQFGTFSALRDVSLQVTGQVLFQGEDSTDRHLRDRRVGFVFQHYALFRHMNISRTSRSVCACARKAPARKRMKSVHAY